MLIATQTSRRKFLLYSLIALTAMGIALKGLRAAAAAELDAQSLDSYTPSDSWAPYVELSANYKINKDWDAFFLGRYISLSSEVKDSPMVDKSYTGVLMTGVKYTF